MKTISRARTSVPTLLLAFSCILLPTVSARAAASQQRAKIVLIGCDAMTFDVLDPLVKAGRMPNVAKLMATGARAVLRSEWPMRSPAIWTTIATGEPRKVHGIYDFVTGSYFWPKSMRGGKERLVTSRMRRAPAVWQMVSRAKHTTLVVNWLASWPAEKVNGVMVAPYVALGQRRQTTIKGKIYAHHASRQTYPRSEFKVLQPLVETPADVSRATIDSIITPPRAGSRLYKAFPRLHRYMYTVRWSVASAETNTTIIEHELQRRPFDLVMTYFDGTDTLAHRFWLLRQRMAQIRKRLKMQGSDPSLAPELKRHFGHAVDGFYELVDTLVGRIVKAAGPGATIIMVSDHGFGSLPNNEAAPHRSVPFDGRHRLKGLFIANGPNISHGSFSQLSVYDITPTLLYLLGVPVPSKLPGDIATEVMDQSFVEAHPPLVMAQGTKPGEADSTTDDNPNASSTAPFRKTELERLRSLGYVR